MISVLVSYAYRSRAVDLPPCHLMLDSGAYTMISRGQPVELRELAAWYRGTPAERYTALDVIYDPVASRANALAMRDMGLDVIPVVHPGTSPDEVDRLADEGFTACALGGTRFGHLDRGAAARWLHRCLDRAGAHQMPVHGFAYCPTRAADVGLLLRFASVDVSSWNQASKYGQLLIWDGGRIRYFHADTERAAAAAILRTWPIDVAGALTRIPRQGKRGADMRSGLWYQISALTYLLYGRWLMARGGPRVYLAGAADTMRPEHLAGLATAFEQMEAA